MFCLDKKNHSFNFPFFAQKSTRVGPVLERYCHNSRYISNTFITLDLRMMLRKKYFSRVFSVYSFCALGIDMITVPANVRSATVELLCVCV